MRVGCLQLEEAVLELIEDGGVILALLWISFFHVFILFRVVEFHFRLFFIFVVKIYLEDTESAFVLELVHILSKNVLRHGRVGWKDVGDGWRLCLTIGS